MTSMLFKPHNYFDVTYIYNYPKSILELMKESVCRETMKMWNLKKISLHATFASNT